MEAERLMKLKIECDQRHRLNNLRKMKKFKAFCMFIRFAITTGRGMNAI
jgi:hypothetical protein